MDIFNGKCAICTEDTFVLSGKDKQKFVDLLKEHYFDVNQMKDSKFLLQFKEKRTRKSICMSCAYIIEGYVSMRNKFKEMKRSDKCSICNNESNLTNGSNKLIEDAHNLLKNIRENKKIRLKQICLECCFCIISWSKIENLIREYTQSEEEGSNTLNGIKRRYSAEDSESDSSETSNVMNELPVRRTLRGKIEKGLDTSNNHAGKQTKSKNTSQQNKKKPKLTKTATDELEEQLKHLCNVSTEVLSKDIYLSDKMASQVISDDKMMFGIAYISFETKQITSKSKSRNELSDNDNMNLDSRKTSVKSESKTSKGAHSLMKSNKNKRKNTSSNLKSQSEALDNNSNTCEVTENKIRKSKRKSNPEDVICISDVETDTSNLRKNNSDNKIPLRISTRLNKGKFMRFTPKKKVGKIEQRKNECSSCNKSFVKKYRLQLHELEHEASFKPVVVVQKENKSNQETKDKTSADNTDEEDNQNEESQKDNGLEKTYKNDTDEKKTDSNDNEKGSDKDDEKDDSDETQFDETIKQVVNETLSQLDKDIITEDSIEEKNDSQEPSNLEGNDALSQDEDPLNLKDISIDKDEITDDTKENKSNKEESKIDEENEKVQAESDSVEENSENKNQQSTNEDDNEKTSNEDSKNETNDETGQQLDNEKSDLKEKINEVNSEDSSQGNDEENKNYNETNGKENDNNFDEAESEKCDKPNQENVNDCTNKENSAAVEEKINSDVVNVSDSDEENNDEQKTDEPKNLTSVLIDDDSSNGSDKVEEIDTDQQIIGEKNVESVVIEDDSSEGEDVNLKTVIENNREPVVTLDDCSNNSDKCEDIDKSIEDDSANKEVNETQNSEDKDHLNNTTDSLFSEDLQTKSNDLDPSDNEQNTNHSDEKKSKKEIEPVDESDEVNSENTDKTNKSVNDDESDMGSLRITPDSVNTSPKKDNELIANTVCSTNSDKFDMVENLLQNLGA